MKFQIFALIGLCLLISGGAYAGGDSDSDEDGDHDFDCNGRPDGLYPNARNCRKFWRCKDGKRQSYNCPPVLHFNPSLKVCDEPDRAGCQHPTTTTQRTTTTRAPSPDFDCTSRPNGLYPNPKNCSNFYKCSNSHAYLYDCPGNLHFNPRLLVCDDPEDAGCSMSTTTTERTTTTTRRATTTTMRTTTTTRRTTTTMSPSPEFNCTGLPDRSSHANPRECESYYVCRNGTAYLYYCPVGYHYNPIQKICDWPYNVQCNIHPTSTSTTTKGPTEGTTLPTEQPEPTKPPTTTEETETEVSTKEPEPTKPSTTTEEAETEETSKPTEEPEPTKPPTTTEEPETEETSKPTEVPEPTKPPTTTEEPETEEPTTLTVTDGPTTTPFPINATTTPGPPNVCMDKPCGVYPNPNSCDAFIICEDGVAEHHKCPKPLLFNPAVSSCDLPGRVKCDLFPCFKKKNGFYQNHKDCRSFFVCYEEEAHLCHCPSDSIFRPDVKYCDYPKNGAHFCKNSTLI